MATNLFNFGPELDNILNNTKQLLVGQSSLLLVQNKIASELIALQQSVDENQTAALAVLTDIRSKVSKSAEQIAAIYSAVFAIPVTIGLDLDNVVTEPQETPTKPGP